MSARLATILATACLLHPALLWACPSCAANNKAGLGSWLVLAGMILFPFAVIGGAAWALKRLGPGLATESEGLARDLDNGTTEGWEHP